MTVMKEYRKVIRNDRVDRHCWIVRDDKGAIEIWATYSDDPLFDTNWFGGIEMHAASAPNYMDEDKCSHENCWVLNGSKCWHDGSSLQFIERVEPMLEGLTDSSINKMDNFIFSEAECYHKCCLGENE